MTYDIGNPGPGLGEAQKWRTALTRRSALYAWQLAREFWYKENSMCVKKRKDYSIWLCTGF
jgi:hypothetical protein